MKFITRNCIIEILAVVALISTSIRADDPTTNDVVNLSSDQIARLRGFTAENLYVTTEDGYIINVVYIPAVKRTNKRPVIFNHGTTQSSTYFMTNSVNARPKDYSAIDAGSLNQSKLEQLLAGDPTAKCMPLLLANFGHDVYLINRRGTEFSLGKTGAPRNEQSTGTSATGTNLVDMMKNRLANLRDSFTMKSLSLTNSLSKVGRDTSADDIRQSSSSSGLLDFLKILLRPQLNLGSIPNTLNNKYWNFSLDEQAKYDLPAIITYVLNRSGHDKVAYVGHSFGNVLMFMLQSEQPEWADKVEPFLAWSPDIYLGHSTSLVIPLLGALQPINTIFSMPFPPTPVDPLTRTLLASLCQTKLAQNTVCQLLENGLWGLSGDQQETLPAFVASQFYSVSSHEAAQLPQTFEKGKIHKFDFGNPISNLKAYGQIEPPIYNVSRIRSTSISLWHGEKDALATPTDVNLFKQDLSVTVDDRFISQIPFNHYSLLFGRNVTTFVNYPSLILIESYK